MNAAQPRDTGFVTRDGVRIAYDVYGEGDRTIVFMPAWSIVHARMWKLQVPYFARHARVVTFDGRGNGRSDKFESLDYSDEAFVADTLAVMDATKTARASIVAISAGARWALELAARHPDRVERVVFLGPAVSLGQPNEQRARALAAFTSALPSHERWDKYNAVYWKDHYRDFVDFFFAECLPEPHSTKQFEDAVSWALQTTPEALAATVTAAKISPEETLDLARSVRAPVVVVHGSADRVVAPAQGRALAEATNAHWIEVKGAGHLLQARHPVLTNVLLGNALLPQRRSKRRAQKSKRALFISSPIGLGHAQRDAAIVAELRRVTPGIKIEWLAQHPVTVVLQRLGEAIHPASAALASETAHVESECGEHDLNAFSAIRRMDEILLNNFMVLYDLLSEEHYDVVVGDEAWDVDYFLHENPNSKRSAFAWMTDFVGWIPMAEGGENERRLTADYNAEMIEHLERLPYVRDRSIFVGYPDDIVPERFGDGLPFIREWTERRYDFAGYITGFVPPTESEREELRARFGYGRDEKICIVTVGGSAAGAALLRRIIAAHAVVRERFPNMRTIVVTGPRIDARQFESLEGLEIRDFVPDLYQHLSACDIALVQGGLTTTMELTASQRPFIYFPLEHHFEQNVHVRYRLERYGAGRCMRFAEATPERIADAIAEELGARRSLLPVNSDGAAKAARMIAELI